MKVTYRLEANESQFLFAVGIGPEHDGQADDNHDRNEDSNRVLRVVRHNVGADEIRGNQGDDGQKKLAGASTTRRNRGRGGPRSASVLSADVVRAMRGQGHQAPARR